MDFRFRHWIASNISDRENLSKPGGFWAGMVWCLVIFLTVGIFYSARDREWLAESVEGLTLGWVESVTVIESGRYSGKLQSEDLAKTRQLWTGLTHSESRVTSYNRYLEKPVLYLQLNSLGRDIEVQIGANGLLQLQGKRGWHLYEGAEALYELLAADQ